ncbi:MAG: oligoendopeptidase F [Ignavibacteriaceae bacterium]
MKKLLALSFVFILGYFSQTISQTSERSEIADNHKWNLSEIYPSVNEFNNSLTDLEVRIEKLSEFKNKLGQSSQVLLDALNTYFGILKDYSKAATYAYRMSDEDLRISENQARTQQVSNLATKFGENTAFFDPEVLELSAEQIDKFFSEKPELEMYRMFIDNIQRLRKHTLNESEEKILASFGLSTGTPSTVYNIFTNAEMPNPKVTLSTGEEIELDASAFTRYRAASVREDRAKVFESFFENHGNYKNTLGAVLSGKVKNDFIYAKNRNYNTSLEYALSGNNIPTSVYETLIKQINESLPTLHRFLDLKKRMLGVDQLHYYDLYTSMVKEVEMNFPLEEGQKHILTALNPMGDEYLSTLQKAFNERWIDYYPNTGKRSGAYSTGGAYDVHPYILMNWTDDYLSVSTLGHELGHTMHSYYSNKTQPYPTSGYSIFVAEIASTMNDNFFSTYMVNNAKNDEEKLYLLGSYLELLRTTIFRQTSFAEFEWEIHKRIEAGEPLTGDGLSNIYYDIVKKYYGHDDGYCVVDPYIAYEWAYIPHFLNYTYYVYQYSTSLIYAIAFSEKIMEEGQPAIDGFYKILKGGSSKYPVDLIKEAGIDPLSPEPFKLAMLKMNKIMDEMEAILNK